DRRRAAAVGWARREERRHGRAPVPRDPRAAHLRGCHRGAAADHRARVAEGPARSLTRPPRAVPICAIMRGVHAGARTMITLLHDQRETQLPDDTVEGDALWLDAAAIERATGWAWKPEGLCRGDICVPVPPVARSELVRGGRLNIAAIWRRSGQPVVHD